MIKKKSPSKRAVRGKAWFLADDELTAIASDPWELESLFDVVVGEGGGYALNTHFFEQLFADSDRVRAKVAPWVGNIASQLSMSQASQDVLIAACESSSRHRRRLRAIVHRGHIGSVTVDAIRRHVRRMELDPSDYLDSAGVFVNDSNVGEVLHILNEDLTRGGLTDEPFRIESKEPLRHADRPPRIDRHATSSSDARNHGRTGTGPADP